MTCWGTPVLISRGAEGVAELVGGDPHGPAGVVAQVDVVLPAGQTPPQRGVAERPGRVGVGSRGGEQHRRGVGPAVEQMPLLGSDGFGGGWC